MRFLQLCWLIQLLLVLSSLPIFKNHSVLSGRMARREEVGVSNVSFVKSMAQIKQMKQSRKFHPLHVPHLLQPGCLKSRIQDQGY